jgi:hypothetical protein
VVIIDTFIFMLVCFLFGYFLGKRLGYEHGLAEGKSIAPLLLRQHSFEQGYCVLCQDSESYRNDSDG